MRYDEARPLIQDGDIVFLRRHHGLFANAITWISQSPETHTCIALWVDSRLMVAGMASTNCLFPLSHYQDLDFDIYECPADRVLIRKSAFDFLGVEIPYAFFDLLTTGIRKLFNLDFGHSSKGMICTAWVVNVLRDAMGHSRFDLIRPDSCPSDLREMLFCKPKFEVRNAV